MQHFREEKLSDFYRSFFLRDNVTFGVCYLTFHYEEGKCFHQSSTLFMICSSFSEGKKEKL